MAHDEKIAAGEVAHPDGTSSVDFPDGLRTDDVAAVGSKTTFADDTDIGTGGTPKTLTVYKTVNVTEIVDAPNLLQGVKITALYSDFAAAALTETLTIKTFSLTKWHPVMAYANVATIFAAPGLSALTWTVGWDGAGIDADGILLTGDSDGLTVGDQQLATAHRGVGTDDSALYPLASSNNVTLSATSVGANLDTLTQGQISIYLWFYRLPLA